MVVVRTFPCFHLFLVAVAVAASGLLEAGRLVIAYPSAQAAADGGYLYFYVFAWSHGAGRNEE